LEALGKRPHSFVALIIQLVSLLRSGEQIAMSTRAGEFVTLSEVLQEVGADAARFIFLSRKSDSPLDFDLELVKKQSLDNPVYYVQYAHARICALQRKATEAGIFLPEPLAIDKLLPLNTLEDTEMLKHLDAFPENLRDAANDFAPYYISQYLVTLAGMVHRYYTMHQVIAVQEPGVAMARLALLSSAGQVLRNGLELLGVTAPESM
jgi:arginyl-tRNA synthetase